MMARPKVHKLTHEQYCQQAKEFGFIAIAQFWKQLTANAPPYEIKERGDAYVQSIAAMIVDELEGQAITPYMAEALQYAGLCVRKEWLQ